MLAEPRRFASANSRRAMSMRSPHLGEICHPVPSFASSGNVALLMPDGRK